VSVPTVRVRPHPRADSSGSRARSFGIWSLWMVPMLIVSFVLSFATQVWILGLKGLEGSEPMSQQGAIGWVSFAVGMTVLLAPLVVGVYLGVKARGLGAQRLGLAGILVNGSICLALLILLFISTLTQ
jgi:hypothetical protein